MSHVTFGAFLSSPQLAKSSGFDRRHIPRKAEKGEIPGAEQTPGGHWKFHLTHDLRAWICFYRVRHALLCKKRSQRETEALKDWGTKWRYALETYDWFKAWPDGAIVDCGALKNLRLGPQTTWETVETVVLRSTLMPRQGWRKKLERESAVHQ
jgi:hypothetical protein